MKSRKRLTIAGTGALLFFVVSGIVFGQMPEREVKVFKINYNDAESIQTVVEHLLSESGRVSVEPNSNSVVVVDYPENLRRIANAIDRLDQRPKEVAIKIVIAEVTGTFLKAIGMQTGQLVIPPEDFDAVLQILDSDEELRVKSQMTVLTMSHHPATVGVTVEEIYGTVKTTDHDTNVEVIEPARRTVGDTLEVLPRVTEDGNIIISLSPTSSISEEDGSLYEKSILTQVIIKDGETVAVSSFDQTRQEREQQEFSLLGTPVSRRDTEENRRIVMFLTATIRDR